MIKCDEGTYDFVKATVTEEGIRLSYQCTGLTIKGSDFIDDESANTWSDRDIQKVVAQHLAITDGEKEIEIIFD